MFSRIVLLGFWAISHVAALPFIINSCIGFLPVMKAIASMGVVFTAPVNSFRAWFWSCSSTLSVCGWAVTRDSQLCVITGRMNFWYLKFKVDRAHLHALPARRFKIFMRLETREAILSTWFFQFNLLSKVTPRYLNSYDWEKAVRLYLNLGCIVLWARENDWKAVFEVFILLFLSHYSSSIASALHCVYSVLSSAFYIPRSRRQGHLHIVNTWCQE